MATAASVRSSPSAADDLDVVIVGAGLSGIDAAYRLQTICPDKRYAILEARDAIGGTWDLFRYPGIRSDSDMYTLGFPFRPWPSTQAIAGGEAIRDYIADTAREFGIDAHIRFATRVVRASWSSAEARWTLEVVRGPAGEPATITCRFLYMGSGYYDYDAGFTPAFEGVETFQGRVVHPQHWPDDLDYAGKRVVVIGSGATAVTLVPSMAAGAAHVTMLQRSPTYIVSRPSQDGFARWTRRRLPRSVADKATKWKSVMLGIATYSYARRRPDRVKAMIVKGVREQLPDNYEVERDFEPRYDPWDQRICLVPDGDLFDAIKAGSASIVTDHIARFTPTGITLASGRELPADIVVTATGLVMRLLGGVELIVDGAIVNSADRLIYKGMMVDGVPNMALAFGYTNASWTLKCDLSARYACRLIRHMDRHGYVSCMPVRDPSVEVEPMLNFTSGYVQRANAILPSQGSKAPWKVHQNYVLDLAALTLGSVDDGVMRFATNGAVPTTTENAAPPRPAPASRKAAIVAGGAAVVALGGLALFAKLTARRVERMVPADGRFVDIGGRRMHVLERGEGPPIVLIHGLGGQMRNFSYALLDRLATDHRVILIDRPGSGYSAPGDGANVRAQAASIAALIAALGLQAPLVVGHSLGGAVALAVALDHPASVGGLALVAPLTHPQDTAPKVFDGLAIASPTARAVLAWTLATPAALLTAERTAHAVFAPETPPADFAIRGGGALTMRPGNYRSASADLVAANDDLPSMVARYRDLSVPTAILFGRDDRILDPTAHGQALADAVPGATLTLIDGGHMIPITQPDDTAAWIRTCATTHPG